MSSPTNEGENKTEGNQEAITIRVRDQVSTTVRHRIVVLRRRSY
jgi:hypothetical protein